MKYPLAAWRCYTLDVGVSQPPPPPRAGVSALCPIMAALCGTGLLSRGGTGGRSSPDDDVGLE